VEIEDEHAAHMPGLALFIRDLSAACVTTTSQEALAELTRTTSSQTTINPQLAP
jgi:hypothetical protein